MLITIVFPPGMSFLLEFLHKSQEISGIQLQFAVDLTVFVKSCGYMKCNSYSFIFHIFLKSISHQNPSIRGGLQER